MRITSAIFGSALACLAGVPAIAAEEPCGGPTPCAVELGSYRIELPEQQPAAGAYLFFHGYQGSADAQMKARGLVNAAHAHGLAFVAVDGLDGTWSHPGAPAQARDERRFIGEVLDDLSRRYGFGPDKIVLGGFSQGASMAWYAACDLGDRASGVVTFAGVFWDPLPKPSDCAAVPPPFIHFHGTNDHTFPLTGRPIGDHWHQGDTLKSIAILRERAACTGVEPAPATLAGIDCEVAAGCARGGLALCLHPGGHEIRAEWLDAALGHLGWPAASTHAEAPSR